MKLPRRAVSSNALPSRREVLAALAAVGTGAVWSTQAAIAAPVASASADAVPSEASHAVVLYPNMGRVVLVFATPPPGKIHVYVDGRELPPEFITVDSSNADAGAPAVPTSNPVALVSAAPPLPAGATPHVPGVEGATRYGIYAAIGTRQITVSLDGQGTASATANVKLGESIDVPLTPQEQTLAGAMPPETYSGGCCGGARAVANTSATSPSLGLTAVAVAVLALRRRSSGER
jgi:hypothetical protein